MYIKSLSRYTTGHREENNVYSGEFKTTFPENIFTAEHTFQPFYGNIPFEILKNIYINSTFTI